MRVVSIFKNMAIMQGCPVKKGYRGEKVGGMFLGEEVYGANCRTQTNFGRGQHPTGQRMRNTQDTG